MSKQVQRQEYEIAAPKTVMESISTTKMLVAVLVSEIIVDRQIFKNLKYTEKSILGIPVKVIKCVNDPEIQFASCLKIAISEINNKNLQSLKIILVSKETQKALEEYCMVFKYNEDTIDVDVLQDDKSIFKCSTENMNQIKQSIINMLKNEKKFARSVNPLPKSFIIKMQCSYNNETPFYDSKYFANVEVPEHELKESSVKLKLGNIRGVFGNPVFTVRSLLFKEDTTDDEKKMKG